MAASSSREGFLEKKVLLLDKRLTQLEKLVEAKLGERLAFQNNENSTHDTGRADLKPKNKRRAETAKKKIASTKHAPDYYLADPLVSDDNNDVLHQSSSTSNSWVNSEKSGDEDDDSNLMKVFESPVKSPPAPLPVKKKRMETAKVTPQIQLEDVATVAPKRRYNTRNKRNATASITAAAEVENENMPLKGEVAELGTEGQFSPANHDYLDEANENENFDDLLQTQPVEADNVVHDDTSKDVSLRSRRDRKRKLPGCDISAEHSDHEYEPPRSECSDDDLDKGTVPSKPRKKTGKSTISTGKRKRKSQPTSTRVPIEVPIAREDGTRKKCPECHKYILIKIFSAHLNSHFKARNLKCPECDKSYFSYNARAKHLMTHQPEKYGMKCRLCGSHFPRSDKALAHERKCVIRALERKEHVDDEIICDIKKRSVNWTPEVAPIKPTNPSQLKECPYCKNKYKASFYQQHIKTKHNTEKREWMCSLCDKSYFYSIGLKRHFASHHHLHSCDICSKTFEDKSELTSHLLECKKEKDSSALTNDGDGDPLERADEGDKNAADPPSQDEELDEQD